MSYQATTIFCYPPLATSKLVNRVSVSSSSEVFWCCPCVLPKVSVTKNLRDAKTHQSGSNESVSTFPKACRFTIPPTAAKTRAQDAESLDTLGTCFSSPCQCHRHSTTSLCEPPSWLGRTHPNPASYFLSPSWGGSLGSLHLQLCFCPAVGNVPL